MNLLFQNYWNRTHSEGFTDLALMKASFLKIIHYALYCIE